MFIRGKKSQFTGACHDKVLAVIVQSHSGIPKIVVGCIRIVPLNAQVVVTKFRNHAINSLARKRRSPGNEVKIFTEPVSYVEGEGGSSDQVKIADFRFDVKNVEEARR